jgi:hypothetical protein
MSFHAPIIALSNSGHSPVLATLSNADLFPAVEASWSEASEAVRRLQPSAIVACDAGTADDLPALARLVADSAPYVPLIALDPEGPLPDNAIPLRTTDADPGRLVARLRAALRVRTLHGTILRRLADPAEAAGLSATDPLLDASALLIGRGAAYPALSVALGERLGVVGALSIEAAAKHLNNRDLDGIILADGFSPRVVDAFLTVLSEDARFRNLPIIVAVPAPQRNYDLPNLEYRQGDAAEIAADALPLIRQHAFEARLSRTLKSLDAGGLLDPRTGLQTHDAFERDLATAVYHAQSTGAGLSVARISIDGPSDRASYDAARIVSRLMRKMDFGTLRNDGAIVVVFAEADLRSAQAIARRLSSVIKQTSVGSRRDGRIDADVAVATMLPNDSARSILARLSGQNTRRAAS